VTSVSGVKEFAGKAAVADDVARSPQIEPFLRGVVWPACDGVSYPRADPADANRLPGDTWEMATVPMGVRLELIGDATDVELTYVTATDDLGMRRAPGAAAFSVWRKGAQVDAQDAAFGAGRIRLHLGVGASDERVVIYVPGATLPAVSALVPVSGTVAPASPQPRWLCYGDSIVEGMGASTPALAWPAVAGRAEGYDTVNLGYSGSARGEIVSAEQLAALSADAVSIAFGTNCWVRTPHSTAQMRANTEAFLRVVRSAHPDIPIVVGSPIVRADAESTPNRLGATQHDLRRAQEDVVQDLIDAGDEHLALVPGLDTIGPDLLADGIHPSDAGHAVLAQLFGDALRSVGGER
jgi:lysophospholipase L1-like esterase